MNDVLHDADSVLKTRNKELDKGKCSIYEQKKTVNRSIDMRRKSRLDFKVHICDIRDALKRYKDELSYEHLQKEEVERAFVHQRY